MSLDAAYGLQGLWPVSFRPFATRTVPRVLRQSVSPVAVVGPGEQIIITIPIPAGSLAGANRLMIDALWSDGGIVTPGLKICRLRYGVAGSGLGGTLIYENGFAGPGFTTHRTSAGLMGLVVGGVPVFRQHTVNDRTLAGGFGTGTSDVTRVVFNPAFAAEVVITGEAAAGETIDVAAYSAELWPVAL